MTVAQRWYAYLFSLAVVLAILAPLLGDPQKDDSFPLSTYPMFSTRRDNPKISKIVAVDANGESRPLPPQVLGTEEVMQAAMTVARAARNKKKARALCRDTAATIADDTAWADATHVEILTLRYDPIEYFTDPDGPEHPTSRKRRARCRIERGAS